MAAANMSVFIFVEGPIKPILDSATLALGLARTSQLFALDLHKEPKFQPARGDWPTIKFFRCQLFWCFSFLNKPECHVKIPVDLRRNEVSRARTTGRSFPDRSGRGEGRRFNSDRLTYVRGLFWIVRISNHFLGQLVALAKIPHGGKSAELAAVPNHAPPGAPARPSAADPACAGWRRSARE